MKRKIVIAVAAVLVLALIGGTVMAKGGSNKAKTGVLENGQLIAYASCWTGATGAGGDCQPVKKYSGRIWEGYGNIGGIGLATVEVSASWDWARGRPAGESNQIYTGDHHGALVVTTSQDFRDSKSDTPHDGDWTAAATVTIMDEDGDIINGVIVGGSVYELVVHDPGPGSINEWLISFEIVGGTGKFEGASGTGTYRMLWDSDKSGPNNNGGYDDSGYGDPARFLEQEIFLHLER